MMHWMRNSTSWYSHPLATLWWRGGEGSNYLGSIPWSCAQQFHFGGESPPHSNLYFVRRFSLPSWTGYLQTFHCLPCRRRPWPQWCLTGSSRLTWTGELPCLSFPWLVYHRSCHSSGPQIHWMSIILCGLYPQLLGVWALVGQRPSGILRPWPRFWYPRVS